METEYRDLADVRELVDFLGQTIAKNPSVAVEIATEKLPLVVAAGACARCELLGSRGTAKRTLGDFEGAAKDFAEAYSTCRCLDCLPRTLRRWAPLWLSYGHPEVAQDFANRAVHAFAFDGETEWAMRARFTRCFINFFVGEPLRAIRDARAVYRYYARRYNSAPLQYGCAVQNLAICLMISDQRKDWEEANQILNEPGLKYVNGFQVLRLKLRWIRALVEIELGLIDLSSGRRRIVRVLHELTGLGLSIDAIRHHALSVAALTADTALLGGSQAMITKGAREALGLISEDGTANLREVLTELLAAVKEGEDLQEPARALRDQCGARLPPLPAKLRGVE